jgi:hypothetical protein
MGFCNSTFGCILGCLLPNTGNRSAGSCAGDVSTENVEPFVSYNNVAFVYQVLLFILLFLHSPGEI